MSKLNPNYEASKWRKIERFVNGEEISDNPNLSKHEEEIREASQEDKERNEQFEATITDLEDRIQKERKRSIEALYRKYEKWPQTKGIKIFTHIYRILAVLFCVCIISVLLMTVSYLPTFGDASNPNNNEVPKRYIEKGIEETGAINFVAGMILDYRAFDTLGESHVLFIAACCVLILLRIDHGKNGKKPTEKAEAEEDDRKFEPKNDKILQKIASLLIPPIIIYGIYVVLNGHLSPGGGFSGGAIIGAGLILYLNAFGYEKIEKFFTYKTYQRITVGALLFYACAKSYSFYTGANHLESGIPKGIPGNILSSGLILPLNVAVGLVVACTMYGFYTLFRKGGM
jgi:multisubunit Na+/H+ antiporter MnhB subunit|nr:hydrogen gas-evolving membrane-bound hydrogenase subunit E [uncultured Lachnoclostridium sp.]